MPRRPPRVCVEVGCPKLTSGSRCDEHQREQHREERQRRGSTTERGLGWKHQQLAAQTIAAQPWCTLCGQTKAQIEARGDKLTAGHIIARADGGKSVAGNYRAECGRCNYGHRGETPPAARPDDRDDEPPSFPVFA